MTLLIKALVGVKDPLTLVGFLCLVLLVAFRTRAVPQLFFGLLQTKLTRERFALLLHRGMLYGLILVVTLCGVAVTGQVLAHVSQPRAAGVEELTAELESWKAGEEAKRQAAASFRDSQQRRQERQDRREAETLAIGKVASSGASRGTRRGSSGWRRRSSRSACLRGECSAPGLLSRTRVSAQRAGSC